LTPATPPELHFIPACTPLQFGPPRLISIKRGGSVFGGAWLLPVEFASGGPTMKC
jgi:hypothetical protein